MSQCFDCGPVIREINKRSSALVLGTAFYTLAKKDDWFAIMDDFHVHGGVTLDSGRIYAAGESENVIGEWMKSRNTRAQMIVITKCGHGKDGTIPENDMESVFADELARSLECLQTDYIDLYMLHRDNPAISVKRIMDCLNGYVVSGRVRALGASNWTYSRIEEANNYARARGLAGFAVVSNNLSLAVPTGPFYPGLITTDKDGEQWHVRTGIPLIPWSSQARGFFTGAYSAALRERAGNLENDFMKRMIEIYCTDDNFERLKRATELGRKKGGYSAVEVALSWVLHKPFPIAPIVGPHSREELRSCIKALSLQLTEDECHWLNLQD
ncbi:MAG: aldo/keto reductase [Verrucomicrobia bacterium]|nr:aldo/keto reductase [Verrucomicrobiota bacterium]MBU4291919.1 aldo/keto reductase [Verrucomicrobiota bacterium]MBU4428422.1 aldo/keto reductase [Verrucomicrobiota bacterium]MBU4497853.1 aldo/keto reductase [Verrucomicrobiota bacterium]MCG2679314.1 aldo/keto reductase [Kiritimatiellia bacterium]